MNEKTFLKSACDALQHRRALEPLTNDAAGQLGEAFGRFLVSAERDAVNGVRIRAADLVAAIMRIMLDGDDLLNAIRAEKGLEPIGGGK